MSENIKVEETKVEVKQEQQPVQQPNIDELVNKRVEEALANQASSFDELFNKKMAQENKTPYDFENIVGNVKLHRTNMGAGYSMDDYRLAKGKAFTQSGNNILGKYNKK